MYVCYVFVLCAEENIRLLTTVGFPKMETCVNYLAGGLDRGEEPKADWQHRKWHECFSMFKSHYKSHNLSTLQFRK